MASRRHAREKAFRESLKPDCCATCGVKTKLLQFSHYNRKDKYRTASGHPRNFSSLSIKQMKQELAKGYWECPICAAIETKRENQELRSSSPRKRHFREKLNDRVFAEKLRIGACYDCNRNVTIESLCAFDFDHLNPKDKIEKVSAMVRNERSMATLEAEMAKCQLVCKFCHANRTNNRRRAAAFNFDGWNLVSVTPHSI